MSSLGVDRHGGGILTGWEHVKQSIEVVLTTMVGTRVMRRDFGSRIMALIDAPMNDRVLLAVFSACADAIAKWEPRYRLETVNVEKAGADGGIIFRLTGTYYPRGHLGDFSEASARLAEITL